MYLEGENKVLDDAVLWLCKNPFQKSEFRKSSTDEYSEDNGVREGAGKC